MLQPAHRQRERVCVCLCVCVCVCERKKHSDRQTDRQTDRPDKDSVELFPPLPARGRGSVC